MNKISPNIYIVDDDVSVREGAGSLMRSEGMKVETFASAQEAWARSQIEVPDCMVLDIQLPGWSGLELQERLAEARIGCPIVFLTGEGDIATSVRAMKAGASEFLTKPLVEEHLLDAVRRGISDDRNRRGIKNGESAILGEIAIGGSVGMERNRLWESIPTKHSGNRFRQDECVEPIYFDDTAVIFTDFENFSETSSQLPPSEIVHQLHKYFSEFDLIAAHYGLEKIKTIGDSYMAVAGVPYPLIDPVRSACDAALEMLWASRRISGPGGWKIRIGVHCGPLVSGIVGKYKFSYDVWGATVNFASRMESSSAPERINVSADIHARLEPDYFWQYRGFQPFKGAESAEMFYLLGKKSNGLRSGRPETLEGSEPTIPYTSKASRSVEKGISTSPYRSALLSETDGSQLNAF